MPHRAIVAMPVIDGDFLTLTGQVAEYLTVCLTVVPAIAFQDVRLWRQYLLGGVVVVGT